MSVLMFIGGLSFFLYGMTVMGKGLASLSGGKAATVLEKMCRTPLRGVLFGALVTAAVQSSSATTVMIVGFVNSGLMSLQHAVGVIMGANLGTTMTAWLLSLSGLSPDNFFLQLLTPKALSPLLSAVGIGLLFLGKKDKAKTLGEAFLGFGILFAGMQAMSNAAAPLAENPQFTRILTLFENPIAGLLAGALLTAVLQSSSASIGILQVLAGTGVISVGTAIPIILGQNIGTCITAWFSGLGAGKNAKSAALVHLYFNLIGSVIFLGAFYLLRFFSVVPQKNTVDAVGIALIHTLFNLSATAVLLPFSSFILKLSVWSVEKKELRRRKHRQRF